MREALRRMYHHMAWADQAIIESLGRFTGSPARAVEIFGHVLAAEKLWLDRIEGHGPPVIAVWPKLTLGECASLSDSTHRALRELLEASGAAELEREISYATSRGDWFTNTVSDILLHLALHGSYHRGQVAAAIRASGGEPVNTDYIHYVRTR